MIVWGGDLPIPRRVWHSALPGSIAKAGFRELHAESASAPAIPAAPVIIEARRNTISRTTMGVIA
jgi:hypothetical protein